MKRNLKKSGHYIFFVIVVTIMITCGISLILCLEEGLSKSIGQNTYIVSIDQDSQDTCVTNQELLEWLEKQDKGFVLYKDVMGDRLVYSNGWSNSPYNLTNNQIWINEYKKKEQLAENGKNYYFFMGCKYEVGGYLDNMLTVIADIKPILEKNTEVSIDGIYYIDAAEDTEQMITELEEVLQGKSRDIRLSYEKLNNNWVNQLLNQSYALLIFVGCTLLLFLGAFTIISSWVHSYMRELFVRRLVGAGEIQLMFYLYFKMLIFRTIGIVAGCIVSVVLTNLLEVLPYNTIFKGKSILVCLMIFAIMDILYTFPMLLIKQKKRLVQIMR